MDFLRRLIAPLLSIGYVLWTKPVLLRIATQNTLRNRRRSAVTLVAIGMAVLVLVLVRGTLNGLQSVLKDKVVYGQTGVVQVHKKGYIDNVKKSQLSFGFSVDEAFLAKLRKVPGVQEVAPRIAFATMASTGDTTLFSLAFGIDPVLEYEVCPVKKRELGTGSLVSAGHSVVSPEVQKQLGLSTKSELTLMAPDAEGILNGALLSVGGFMADHPAFTGDRKLVLLPLDAAQALLRMEGKATEIALKSQELDAPDALRERVQAALGADYEVHTWRQLARFAVEALDNQEVALGFVISVFIVIALFGILNTMLMIVLSRTKEIGTMMAVGVTRREILALIVTEAALLGGLGAVIGAALGMGLVALLHSVGLPITTPGGTVPEVVRPVIGLAFVSGAVAMAVIGAAVASIYPAFRASSMTPVAALSSL